MMRRERIIEASQSQTAMLSDQPVLELLNTTPMVDGTIQELLQTDADVLRTLTRLGWPIAFRGAGLLASARDLREEIRRLVESRKAGDRLELTPLNAFLAAAKSHLELSQDRGGALAARRIWEERTPYEALAPVAEAAADLLTHGNFELVRRCEGASCVLWFYDRTRSHRRRWCSMASCGNRHKVAAFRKRGSEG